jgi:hypothetical protein
MPTQLKIRTQNTCKHCRKAIIWFGGLWKHRETHTMHCERLMPRLKAEPLHVEGSPEHVESLEV